MKKFLITAILAVGFVFVSQAQEISKNAIGLRIGDSKGFGTEVNYQRAIGGNNRLEFGLGWRSNRDIDAYKLTALYQWVWNIDGGFNWYAGAGGGIGSINFDNDRFPNTSNETFAFAAGTVGIEYDFNIPLLLSLDFRPELGFGNYRNDLNFDIALGIRYQF